MDGLIQWGLQIVQWIQTFRNPVFDAFFLTINFLGEEEFYILCLPLIFWCLHKALGMRLGAVLVFSTFINQSLKDFFAAPRPHQYPNVWSPLKTTGFGIPSGHSQGTATFWGYLATQLNRGGGHLPSRCRCSSASDGCTSAIIFRKTFCSAGHLALSSSPRTRGCNRAPASG